MNAEEAKQDLAEAQLSYAASVRTVLPGWVPPACGLLVAGAVAIPGLGYTDGWWRIAAVLTGVALAVSARLLLSTVRARRGIRGLHGPARRTQASLVISGVAYLISAMNATAPYRWIFVAMGVVVGIVTWISLSRKAQP